MADVVAALQSIAKTGSFITLMNQVELRPIFHDTSMRLGKIVSFQITIDNGNPSISNISGVAVHKILWIDLQQVQIIEQNGQRMVHVVTAHGSRDFPLS